MGYRVTYRKQINSFKYGTTDYIIIASRSRSGVGSVLQGTGRKGNMAAAQQPENGHGIYPEQLSAGEDLKKVERRLKSEEKKITKK